MKSNIFFVADFHFNHANVIKFCNRPFETVEEMNEALITNFNKTVGVNDTCIWVGDCFWINRNNKEIMQRLNGKHILVRGNHDKSAEGMLNLGFTWVCEEMVIQIEGELVTISHYPFKFSWLKNLKRKCQYYLAKLMRKDYGRYDVRHFKNRPDDRGQFLIHGHTHSPEKFNGRMIHVGVDAWNYKPVRITEIAKYIREYKKNDN